MIAANLGVRDAPVIPCAVDLDLFAPLDRAAARRALGWPLVGPCVLFPSARSDRSKVTNKRVDVFDAMIERLRRSEPGVVAASLDGLSRKQVALAMNAADVAVLTSMWEGAPVVVKESLACQTPVVSVAVGDVSTVIAGLPGCAIVQRDPDALARAVERALRVGPRSATAGSHACLWARADRGAGAPRLSPSASPCGSRDEGRGRAEGHVHMPEPRGGRRRAAVGDPGPRSVRARLRRERDDARRPRRVLRGAACPRCPDRMRGPPAPSGPGWSGACCWLGWPRSSAVVTRGVSAHLVGHVLARRQRAAHVVTEHLGDDPLGIRAARRHQRLLLGADEATCERRRRRGSRVRSTHLVRDGYRPRRDTRDPEWRRRRSARARTARRFGLSSALVPTSFLAVLVAKLRPEKRARRVRRAGVRCPFRRAVRARPRRG